MKDKAIQRPTDGEIYARASIVEHKSLQDITIITLELRDRIIEALQEASEAHYQRHNDDTSQAIDKILDELGGK